MGDEETLNCKRRNTARRNQTCVAHKRRGCFITGACTANLTSWLLTFTFALQRKQKGSAPQRGASCTSQKPPPTGVLPKFDCVCMAVETRLPSRKLMLMISVLRAGGRRADAYLARMGAPHQRTPTAPPGTGLRVHRCGMQVPKRAAAAAAARPSLHTITTYPPTTPSARCPSASSSPARLPLHPPPSTPL